MEEKDLPIGFMDSGLGGLSVLREAARLLPAEDFIYYGDSQNAPYGNKPQAVIRALTFAAVEHLCAFGIKGLVIACNTATGAAAAQLRAAYPRLPIIGIEPAIKPAVLQNHGGRIVVLATPMTIRQEKFRKLLDAYKAQADIVPVECAGLMEFVERGDAEDAELYAYFAENLTPHLSENTETVVLGCTHYPFLKRQLRAFLGDRPITIIDGSYGTAAELQHQMAAHSLLRTGNRKGQITILNSTGREDMLALSRKLLSMPLQ